jgi:hypothetical protein
MARKKGMLAAGLALAFVSGAGLGAVVTHRLEPRPTSRPEETRFLNFDPESTPMGSLASGWSSFEITPSHDSFVWCAAQSCTVEVQAHGPREHLVRVRTWPFRYANSPPQSVTVTVNQTAAGAHELGELAETWELLVPAAAWKDGTNTLRFDFSYATTPAGHEKDSRDNRALSAAFDWLEIVATPW